MFLLNLSDRELRLLIEAISLLYDELEFIQMVDDIPCEKELLAQLLLKLPDLETLKNV